MTRGAWRRGGLGCRARTAMFLMLMGLQAITLASQSGTLHAELTGSGFPTVKVVAAGDCENPKGKMLWKSKSCRNDRRAATFWKTVTNVCTENGGKLCLGLDLANETCVIITGKIGQKHFESSELNLNNVTFPSVKSVKDTSTTPWERHGNRSILYLQPIPGVPVYSLFLEPINGKNCSVRKLRARESAGMVTFPADWQQEFVPGCVYKTSFSVEDECGAALTMRIYRGFHNLQHERRSAQLMMLVKPTGTGVNLVMVVGTVVVLGVLAVAVVLSLKLCLARTRPRNEAHKPACLALEKGSDLPGLPQTPRILLVYSPRFHQAMAALAADLRKLTGLQQIEDLYDAGDGDKLIDPTVWLTRRLMDANTLFVLAASPANPPDSDEHKGSHQEGTVLHYLLDHFLQHLQSSSLAYDYKRLHQVRFEGQEGIQSDVTPGRLYHLPAHLPQLARNLAHPEVPVAASLDQSSTTSRAQTPATPP